MNSIDHEAAGSNVTLHTLIRTNRRAWTATELGELLRLTKQHIYKLAKSGRMPSYRLGGAIRFDPKATADWLQGQAIGC